MASSATHISVLYFANPILPKRPSSPSMLNPKAMAKELHFNQDGSTTKKLQVTVHGTSSSTPTFVFCWAWFECLVWTLVMQAGVDMVAELVGVTLGPKGRNVVLQNKYGPPKIVNDGETVLKEVLHTYPFVHYPFSHSSLSCPFHYLITHFKLTIMA